MAELQLTQKIPTLLQEVVLSNGQRIRFNVARFERRPSYFLLGVRKSGSSICNKICSTLAFSNGYFAVDIAGRFFENNVTIESWIDDPATNDILFGGNLYGGFRNFPRAIGRSEIYGRSKKVLLVRDPRDALVSEYFSLAYSHMIPAPSLQGSAVTDQMNKARKRMLDLDINDAVQSMAANLNKTLMEYAPVTQDSKALVLKYEDAIMDKTKLMNDICHHFGWTVTPSQIQEILSWADIRPAKEDEKAFVRKVVPGDHKEKLTPSTIDKISGVLRESMQVFGYS